MSAMTSAWALIETETPVTPAVESGKVYRREEEFRSALDNYIAGYVADQQKPPYCDQVRGQRAARDSYFTVFWRAPLSGRGKRDSSRTDAIWSSTASRSGDER
jgi:hypothetical protein